MCCRATRSCAPPWRRSKSGKPLPPLVTIAQDGAAELLYGLGVVGNTQGDELTAIIYLRLGLDLNPDHALALVTLGDVYERLKQYDRANEIFARVPKNSPAARQRRYHHRPESRNGRTRRTRPRAISSPPDEGAARRRGGRDRARQRAAFAQAVRRGGRNLQQGDRADRDAGSRPLDPLLLPRNLL